MGGTRRIRETGRAARSAWCAALLAAGVAWFPAPARAARAQAARPTAPARPAPRHRVPDGQDAVPGGTVWEDIDANIVDAAMLLPDGTTPAFNELRDAPGVGAPAADLLVELAGARAGLARLEREFDGCHEPGCRDGKRPGLLQAYQARAGVVNRLVAAVPDPAAASRLGRWMFTQRWLTLYAHADASREASRATRLHPMAPVEEFGLLPRYLAGLDPAARAAAVADLHERLELVRRHEESWRDAKKAWARRQAAEARARRPAPVSTLRRPAPAPRR